MRRLTTMKTAAALTLIIAVLAGMQPVSAQLQMTNQTSKNKKHFNLNFLKHSHYPHMQHQSDKPIRRKV